MEERSHGTLFCSGFFTHLGYHSAFTAQGYLAGNEPMLSNMLAAIATRVGPIRPAIVFEVVIYAPLRMRHRAMISRVQSPRVERIGRAESLSSSFCRWRASRPQ